MGELVNLTVERVERRPIELDHRCRDCGMVCNGLVALADHYAFTCTARAHHPAGRG